MALLLESRVELLETVAVQLQGCPCISHIWGKVVVAAQTARLYDAGRRTLRGSYSLTSPALDGAFQDDSVIYVGGLDGVVRRRALPGILLTCFLHYMFASPLPDKIMDSPHLRLSRLTAVRFCSIGAAPD